MQFKECTVSPPPIFAQIYKIMAMDNMEYMIMLLMSLQMWMKCPYILNFIHICKDVNNIIIHSILSIAMDFISIYVCLSKHVVSFMRFNENAIT
jgi:hypothetical protein